MEMNRCSRCSRCTRSFLHQWKEASPQCGLHAVEPPSFHTTLFLQVNCSGTPLIAVDLSTMPQTLHDDSAQGQQKPDMTDWTAILSICYQLRVPGVFISHEAIQGSRA